MACQRKDNFHSQKFVINFLVKVRINACFQKTFFFLLFMIYLTFLFYVHVKVSDPLQLDLQTIVNSHVGAGN